jgi:hypothetical protein
VSEVTVRPVDAGGVAVRPMDVAAVAVRPRFGGRTATAAALVTAALIWLFIWFGVQTAGAVPATPVEAWHVGYDGPAHLDDDFRSVITAANGDAVVAGLGTAGRARGTDVLLARYSAGGARRWVRLWDGPAGGDDRARAVVADGTGGFYVVGRIAGRGHDLLVMRYSSTGVLRWYRSYDGGYSRYDEGLFATTDRANNVYVVGTSWLNGRLTWRILKYDKTGRQLWNRSFGSGYEALPTDVATDGNGRLFVTGTYGGRIKVRGMTRAYSPGGTLLWATPYDYSTRTWPSGIAYAPDGLYLAISRLTINDEPISAQIVKQSAVTGDQIWSAGWTTVPDGRPYKFLDVAVLPSYGAVAVGDYRAFPPSQVAGLFAVDASGLNPTAAAWPDPEADTFNRFVADDGGGGAWSLGSRMDSLAVSRFSPASGVSGLFVYTRGELFTEGQALATQGSALYVAGYTQFDEGDDTQGLLLRVN